MERLGRTDHPGVGPPDKETEVGVAVEVSNPTGVLETVGVSVKEMAGVKVMVFVAVAVKLSVAVGVGVSV